MCHTLPQLRSHLGTRSSSAWLCLVLCTPPALPSLHFAPPDDEIPRSSPPASPLRAVSEQLEMPADRCQSGSKVPLHHVSPSSVLRGAWWGQLVRSPVLTAASHLLLARLILTRVLLSRRVHLPRCHGAVLTAASHQFAQAMLIKNCFFVFFFAASMGKAAGTSDSKPTGSGCSTVLQRLPAARSQRLRELSCAGAQPQPAPLLPTHRVTRNGKEAN